MKLFTMTRVSPEIEGGPTELNIQEQDIPILEARGWVVKNKVNSENPKTPDEPDVNSEKKGNKKNK